MSVGLGRAAEQATGVAPAPRDRPPAVERRAGGSTGRTPGWAGALRPVPGQRRSPRRTRGGSPRTPASPPTSRASALTSRCPSPPSRSSRCTRLSRACPTCSRSCTTPYAVPAAARSISSGFRACPATVGGSGLAGSREKRSPGLCQATSRGRMTVSELSGCSNRRASNCSTGPRAASVETGRSAPARAPVGDQARRSNTSATFGSHSASSVSTSGRRQRTWRGGRQRARIGTELLAYGTQQMQALVGTPEQRSLA